MLGHDSTTFQNTKHMRSLRLSSEDARRYPPTRWEEEDTTDDVVAGATDDSSTQNEPLNDPNYLRDKISKLLAQSHIGLGLDGRYIDDDTIKKYFTYEAVQCALGNRGSPGLVSFIMDFALSTFATLLLVFYESERRLRAMMRFYEKGFTDEFLLDSSPSVPHRALRLCSTKNCRLTNPDCACDFPLKDPWDETTVTDFKAKSAHFKIQSFDSSLFTYEIDGSRHLPIVKFRNEIRPSTGHFSDVNCVEMLTDKQNKIKSSEKTIVVALKTLKRISEKEYDIETEWNREAAAYRRLNDTTKQIIQGIAAVRFTAFDRSNDTYHLILEWADGGTLHEFQKNHPEKQVDDDIEQSRKRVMELLKQILGLAEALEYMHATTLSTPGHSRRNSSIGSDEEFPDHDEVNNTLAIPSHPAPVKKLAPPRIEVQAPDDQQEPHATPHTTSSTSLKVDSPQNMHLARAGSFLNSENWRHGDIKPENILRFCDGSGLGTLKLADLGRAQLNEQITRRRTTGEEKEPWRTRWYEPPDLYDRNRKKISRLFDSWSMGCVIFEAVLWYLYGRVAIDSFETANQLDPYAIATPYWRKTRTERFEISEIATSCMNHILQKDPERQGAIGEIVRIVKERLLQIKVPDDLTKYTPGYRTSAADLREQVEQIIAKAEKDPGYLLSDADRSAITFPFAKSQVAETASANSTGSSILLDNAIYSALISQSHATAIANQRIYTNSVSYNWTPLTDARFVDPILRHRQYLPVELLCCDTCDVIDFLSQDISFNVENLKFNAEEDECDFCQLVYSAIEPSRLEESAVINLERSAENFVFRGTHEKVLRLCRTNIEASSVHKDIPIGAPELPAPPGKLTPHSDGHFVDLLKTWVKTCDTHHTSSCASSLAGKKLPKRLINVKSCDRPKIVESSEIIREHGKRIRYMAFSHRWGNMPDGAVTTPENVEARKKRLPKPQIPQSFRDAIAVTCLLGCEYLWIDSLCILQGQGGDFNEEADTMQDTFSNAYCIIAACDVDGSSNGFLSRKESRVIQKDGIYLSSITNDFERDVLQSPLNRRGWVLQERALARRTIFFTKNQMYFECGDGIRCETLAKLKNDEVAFLGDPNFPNYTIREDSTRGSQIHLFTRLFEMYSKLEFSHPEDRPIAIDGLMHRLTTAFKTHSLAGLFQAFWGRCLLWKRAGKKPLRKIPQGPHTKRMPPSWSWMAYEGPISFFDPVGGQVDWNDGHDGVSLPFHNRAQSSWLKTSNRSESNALRAHVFGLSPALGNAREEEAFASFDSAEVVPFASVKCFVVGAENQVTLEQDLRKHFVVLVRKSESLNQFVSYERVGVGHMLGKFIRFEESDFVSID
ncbi:hypothetical protein J1614_003842 [Plenodomus biglobosus]|nr:hypothetical protein J1614_003842 [Plenodomus biglobosus]